ncbi:uncharacterized protein LOC134750154 [Cydia strobilella]|uniref:uncharacterized protein LOC134744479 n=1 Tax=Cydia strobilella TaxID=1100964 RepID=UPI003003EF54
MTLKHEAMAIKNIMITARGPFFVCESGLKDSSRKEITHRKSTRASGHEDSERVRRTRRRAQRHKQQSSRRRRRQLKHAGGAACPCAFALEGLRWNPRRLQYRRPRHRPRLGLRAVFDPQGRARGGPGRGRLLFRGVKTDAPGRRPQHYPARRQGACFAENPTRTAAAVKPRPSRIKLVNKPTYYYIFLINV